MRRRFKSTEHPVHFVSGYIRHRIPLFQLRPTFAPLFLEALCFYREHSELRIYGYVVMPDHFHLVLGFPEGVRVSNFLRDFKSFLGKQFVERLASEGSNDLLSKFRLPQARKRRRDPTYAIFQPDNDDRVIYSEKFFRQKINYVHANPLRKGLVRTAAEYTWSSCRSYITGEPHPIALDRWA